MNNGRNPTKKRGCPPKELSTRKHMTDMLGTRNKADMTMAVVHGLAEDLKDELSAMADRKETSLTVLAYVARFPHEQQREMFETLNRLGARGAKRYVECLTRPPTIEQMGERIARWLAKEFPSLSFEKMVAGCQKAADLLKAASIIKAAQEDPTLADVVKEMDPTGELDRTCRKLFPQLPTLP